MKRMIQSLVLMLAVVLAACSDSGPSGVAGNFFHRVDKGEMQEAASLMTGPGVAMLGKEKMAAMLSDLTDSFQKKGGIRDIETVSEEVNGGTATVRLRLTFEDGTTGEEKLDMVKVDGNWMIYTK